MKTFLLSTLCLLAITASAGSDNPTRDPNRTTTRLNLYDEYIATYCDLISEYRTEITLGISDYQAPLPPFRITKNPVLGPYLYRPKRFTELTPQQQVALENDEKFLAYRERKTKDNSVIVTTIERGNLVQARRVTETPTTLQPSGVTTTIDVRIAPEDMLTRETVVYEEPPTAQPKPNPPITP